MNILRQENEKSTIEVEQTKVQLESIKTELELKQVLRLMKKKIVLFVEIIY